MKVYHDQSKQNIFIFSNILSEVALFCQRTVFPFVTSDCQSIIYCKKDQLQLYLCARECLITLSEIHAFRFVKS